MLMASMWSWGSKIGAARVLLSFTNWDSGVIFFLWNNRCVVSVLIIADFMSMSYPNFMLFKEGSIVWFYEFIHAFVYTFTHNIWHWQQHSYLILQEVKTLLPFFWHHPGSGEVADENCPVWQVNRSSKRRHDSVWLSNNHRHICVFFSHHSYSYQTLDRI